MGIILLGVALIVGILTMTLGLLGFFSHRNARKNGRGSWPLYCLIGTITAIVFVVAAIAISPSAIHGAPTGEDFERAMLGLCLVSAAPGAGLLTGSLAALKQAPVHKNEANSE